MNKINLICKHCNNKFEVLYKNRNQKFCSQKCSQLHQVGKNNCNSKEKIILICKQCNKKYKVYPYEKDRQFCSRDCKHKYHSVLLICKECGKEYKTKLAKKDSKFCSRKCKNKNVTLKIKKICSECNKIFYTTKSVNALYCSKDCWNKNRSGNKAPNWQGGISFEPYCLKFNEQLKEEIRDKYNRNCAICGKPEINKKHAVHHIDYDKSQGCNGQDILMVPLCNSCHSKTSGKKNRDYYETILTKLELTRIMIIEYRNKIDWRSIGI